MSTPKHDNVQTALDLISEAEYRDEIGEPDVAAARRAEAQIHAALAVTVHLASIAESLETIAAFTQAGGRP